MQRQSIGIIGGGLSGLTAAFELYRQLGSNVKITIIEKESYLGGRIFSKEFQGCPIELGAQFFIDAGSVFQLLKNLEMESDIIPLGDNFISFYYDDKPYSREQLQKISIFKERGELELKQLIEYTKTIETSEEMISYSFNEWYEKAIGKQLSSFWERLLMSIGIRDAKSTNAYFGLILLNVFFGRNNLFRGGLQQLIGKLEEKIRLYNGEIITGAECNSIEYIKQMTQDGKYQILFTKNGETKQLYFDKIISAIQPADITKIFDIDVLKPLEHIDGHPMALYVVETKMRLWEKTWGIVICKEKSPIYAICDWKNVIPASEKTPILLICSPSANKEDIISELKNLFPKSKSHSKIIYEKKWTIGLHQPNKKFFINRKKVAKNLPKGFFLAGDWMVLPALEGAVLSGIKAAKLLLNEK
jgi:protoporphyrinogen oxidase